MPFEPEFTLPDIEGIGGRIGSEPEDFRVDEVPLYPASGSGQHHYVRIEKRGMTTGRLIAELARLASVSPSEIGSAGMKDKHAVTSQWLSVPTTAKGAPSEWQLPEGCRLLDTNRHDNKIKTGHLLGNRFAIRLQGVEADPTLLRTRTDALCSKLRESGLLNYFGAQRFGHGGQNLARSLTWVERGARRRSRFESKLYPSVIQSEVFNRYLASRRALGFERLLLGEVVRLDNSGKSFVVEDVEAETPRFEKRDLHLLGPMFGPKMRASHGVPHELEQQAMADAGVDARHVALLARLAPGTRRDLVVPVEDLQCHLEATGSVVLSFGLPSGCYATGLVREFCRSGFLDDPRAFGEG